MWISLLRYFIAVLVPSELHVAVNFISCVPMISSTKKLLTHAKLVATRQHNSNRHIFILPQMSSSVYRLPWLLLNEMHTLYSSALSCFLDTCFWQTQYTSLLNIHLVSIRIRVKSRGWSGSFNHTFVSRDESDTFSQKVLQILNTVLQIK